MWAGRSRIAELGNNLKRPFPLALLACSVAFLSYLAAKIGGALMLRTDMVWPLWPGCAFLVAVLLLTPRPTWPILTAAGLTGFVVYDLLSGVALHSIILLVLADAIEIPIAAFGASYAFDGEYHLVGIKRLWRYLIFGVILASFAIAFVGAFGLTQHPYWLAWRISFFTEALALLTVTPVTVGWVDTIFARPRYSAAYYFEAGLLIAGLALVSYFAFVAPGAPSRPVLLYLLVPFLLWSALRFGSIGVATSTLVVAFLSIGGTVHGRGPFTGSAPLDNVLSLQLFLVVAAMPFMVLGSLVEERRQSVYALRESEQRFRLVANTAPVMIWMSGPDKLCNYFNQPWLDFTGRSVDAELGMGWSDGVHDEDLKRCVETYTRAFDRREPFKMQYRLRRHDGEYRWLFDHGVPRFDADGSFAGYIGSCIDVTERKMAEEALANFGGRLIEAQESECRRIAREIHDDFNQRLAMLAIELEEVSETIAHSPHEEVGRRLHELFNQVGEMGADMHSLSHTLHSSTLENLGLVAGLKAMCNEFSEQQDIRVDFSDVNVPRDVPGDAALCLFRVAQEALRNVKRHSGSERAEVRLEWVRSNLHLSIADHGSGIDPTKPAAERGIGIRSMEERLRLLGGQLEIHSRPQEGTRIDAWVPLKSPARKEESASDLGAVHQSL